MMHNLGIIILLLAVAWDSPLMVQSSKILMVPVAMLSHFSLMTNLAVQLAKKGHHVDIYYDESFKAPNGIENDLIHYITFKGNESVAELLAGITKNIQDQFDLNHDILTIMKGMRSLAARGCEDAVMHKDHYLDQLEANDYDLAVTDNMFLFKCLYLIPHRLGLPIVSIVDFFEHWTAKLPWFPSVVPSDMMLYTDRMSFKERLINTFLFVTMPLVPLGQPLTDEMIEKYSQYGVIRSIDDIVERTVLWLCTHDLVIDYPRPSMPNIIQVGGLALKPAKPLSSHLLESITAWPAGFIVVSFGSGLSHLRPKHAVPLLEVFSKLDLLIIWRFENKDKHDIPKNVLLMNWLPQNDLLANENVKLFITHCGRSSLFEAIHYAVPMIGMPIFGDQPHNAKKMEAKGFGEVVDLMHIDSQDVYSKMNKVLNNDSYKNSIAKASRIFNSRPEKPVERAVAGIEHILEFGGEHLRSVAFDLPWYQYWMVDIIALVLVGIHVMVYVANKCIVVLFRKCCGQKKKEKQN